jgi:hypothetical protein
VNATGAAPSPYLSAMAARACWPGVVHRDETLVKLVTCGALRF